MWRLCPQHYSDQIKANPLVTMNCHILVTRCPARYSNLAGDSDKKWRHLVNIILYIPNSHMFTRGGHRHLYHTCNVMIKYFKSCGSHLCRQTVHTDYNYISAIRVHGGQAPPPPHPPLLMAVGELKVVSNLRGILLYIITELHWPNHTHPLVNYFLPQAKQPCRVSSWTSANPVRGCACEALWCSEHC